MWKVSAEFTLKFEQAIKFFRSKTPITDDEFKTLEGLAKTRAFTVAGIAQLDLVQDVFDGITTALEDGTDFKTFKQTLASSLSTAWGTSEKIAGFKLERIYRTNLQTAYSAGRITQLTNPDVLKARPYWMFDAVLDKRTSNVCSSASGTILDASDSWWSTHTPPLHYFCRSGLRSLTTRAAAKKGITTNPPDVKAGEGFGETPALNAWEPNLEKYDSGLLETYKEKQP